MTSSVFVPKHIADKRLKICEECDNYTVRIFRFCDLCKCILPAKVVLANTDCPIGNWKEIENRGAAENEIAASETDYIPK